MSKLEVAANQAIFQLQLNSERAVKYVESQVPGAERGAVIAALVDAMTFHRKA